MNNRNQRQLSPSDIAFIESLKPNKRNRVSTLPQDNGRQKRQLSPSDIAFIESLKTNRSRYPTLERIKQRKRLEAEKAQGLSSQIVSNNCNQSTQITLDNINQSESVSNNLSSQIVSNNSNQSTQVEDKKSDSVSNNLSNEITENEVNQNHSESNNLSNESQPQSLNQDDNFNQETSSDEINQVDSLSHNLYVENQPQYLNEDIDFNPEIESNLSEIKNDGLTINPQPITGDTLSENQVKQEALISDYQIWISIALQSNFYVDDEGNIPLNWQQLAKEYYQRQFTNNDDFTQGIIDEAIARLDNEDKTLLNKILNLNDYCTNQSLLVTKNQYNLEDEEYLQDPENEQEYYYYYQDETENNLLTTDYLLDTQDNQNYSDEDVRENNQTTLNTDLINDIQVNNNQNLTTHNCLENNNQVLTNHNYLENNHQEEIKTAELDNNSNTPDTFNQAHSDSLPIKSDNNQTKPKPVEVSNEVAEDNENLLLNSAKNQLNSKPVEVSNEVAEDNGNLPIKSDNNQTNSKPTEVSNQITEVNESLPTKADKNKSGYKLIEDDEELKNEIALLTNQDILAIDTETTGLDPHIHKIRLIQIASENHPTILIDCFKCDAKLIQPLLTNSSIKIFHNAKFDLQFFLALGLEVSQTVFDTMIANQLLTAGKGNIKSSLKAIASQYLNIELNKDEQVSDWKLDKLSASQLEYAVKDAQILLPLREKLREEIINHQLTTVAKIEFDCIHAVAMMEFNGMLLDVGKWQEILREAINRKEELAQQLQQLLPSVNSSQLSLDFTLFNSNNNSNLTNNNQGNYHQSDTINSNSLNKLSNHNSNLKDNSNNNNSFSQFDSLNSNSSKQVSSNHNSNLNNNNNHSNYHQLDSINSNSDKDLFNNNNPSNFNQFGNINLDSPKQLLEALNRAGIDCKNTNSKTLKKLLPQYPQIIKPLLEYKKLTKIISSFGDGLLKKINPVTGRLHGSYSQLKAQSGRFTSSNPNLQQIPRNKETRTCFVATPNHKLIIADYSQIELRIAAELTRDKTMIEAYNNGEDLHKLTASIVLNKPLDEVTKEDRQIAKSANFGLIYGASVNGFRGYAESNYGISLTEKEAKKIMGNFFKSYQGLAKWHKQTKTRIYRQGITETRTLSGRIRYFDKSTPQQVLNTPVQGLGADMLKLALGKLVTALKGYDCRILATVHDEIILEAHESIADEVAKILSETMVSAGKEFLKLVPVEADASIGDNWSDK